MSGDSPTSTCPSSSITFGRVFEGTSLFEVFDFVNCNLQLFPIWSKWKLRKSTEESSFLMDFQPFNLQRSFAQSTERVDNLWRKYICYQDVLYFAGRPQGRYYRPLVDNRPFCPNGRYSWICGRYCIKMVDISSKSLKMVIDFPIIGNMMNFRT